MVLSIQPKDGNKHFQNCNMRNMSNLVCFEKDENFSRSFGSDYKIYVFITSKSLEITVILTGKYGKGIQS